MFSEVKNVNVESLKIGSKLLDFFGSLPQPLPNGKGFSISPLMSFNCLINCPINSIQFVNNSSSNKINSCLPNKNNSCPQKTKAALMNPFMSIDGEERGRSEPKKSNNFEPFFSDSTLTFLTSENTFRLPILPSRRIILLCLPLI